MLFGPLVGPRWRRSAVMHMEHSRQVSCEGNLAEMRLDEASYIDGTPVTFFLALKV